MRNKGYKLLTKCAKSEEEEMGRQGVECPESGKRWFFKKKKNSKNGSFVSKKFIKGGF